MNKREPVECECGNFYADQTGADWCRANSHGKGADAWNSQRKLMNSIETEITVECLECGTTLRSNLKVDGSQIRVIVLPHICAVDAPEVIEGVAA